MIQSTVPRKPSDLSKAATSDPGANIVLYSLLEHPSIRLLNHELVLGLELHVQNVLNDRKIS